MNPEKFQIKNRNGLKLVIQVDAPSEAEHLVFIAHGQGGHKNEKHIRAFAEAFLENNFRVIRFDATHSLGESEGDIVDVTYDNYIEDLEDVINWAREQDWFKQPFALCGHSMGAQSSAWYAENHPEHVNYLLPIAPVVNYPLHFKTFDEEEIWNWQKKGYIERHSKSRPGLSFRVGWGVLESLKRYDLLPKAYVLTMPVLDIVGENDQPCPPAVQQQFIDSVASDKKKLVVIAGVDHIFRTADGDKISEVKSIISDWLIQTLK